MWLNIYYLTNRYLKEAERINECLKCRVVFISRQLKYLKGRLFKRLMTNLKISPRIIINH